MGLDELGTRLLRRQWWLIMVCLNAAVAFVVLQQGVQSRDYVATVRLLVTDTTPKSSAEAAAVVSHARALATSRDLVSAAMHRSGVPGDAAEVAAHQVRVSGLGTSPVVQVAVSDRNPSAAQQIANALGAGVVRSLNAAVNGNLPQVLKQVDNQLDVLSRRRAPIAAQAAGKPQDILLQSRLAGIDRIISDLSSDRNRLAIESAAGHHAQVVDPAVAPIGREPSHLLRAVVLAGLLGLILGLLLAALREWLQPTIGSLPAIGRLLDAPLLGRMGSGPILPMSTESLELRHRIHLAAARRSVTTLAVLGPLPKNGVAASATDLDLLCNAVPPAMAARLPRRRVGSFMRRDRRSQISRVVPSSAPRGNGAKTSPHSAATDGAAAAGVLTATLAETRRDGDGAGAQRGVPGKGTGSPDPRLTVRAFDTMSVSAPDVAAIVVAPDLVSSRRLEDVQNMLALSGWPVLGVVGVRPSRYPARRFGRNSR